MTRKQLDEMPDPELAHARRGAHWTFDAAGFVRKLQTVRRCVEDKDVYIPSFDHGVGDPVEDDICVHKHCRAVIVEGNYIFLGI